MKTLTIKHIFSVVLIGFIAISCGKENLPTDYTEYAPKKLADNDGNLTYQNITTYPEIGKISSEAPSVSVEGVSKFMLGDITAPSGSTYTKSKFSIDNETGVVSYNNNGDLSPGTYFIDIQLGYLYGVVTYSKVFQLEVQEVPISVSVDNPTPSLGIFEQGVVATVSYSDTSGSGLISSVSYALVNPPTGFTIDSSTGEISKGYPAESGENLISVKVTTNLGAITINNLVNVTVGDAPTIQYVKQDGTTALSNVVLSPWTAYTSATPQLVGMSASSYDIILPETLVPGSVVANADGTISIAADQNIAVGTYTLGVKVTNTSGIEVIFDNIFDLTVENRWQPNKLFDDTFDDGTIGPLDPVNPNYPDYAGYTLGTTSAWAKVVVTKSGVPDIEGLRVFNPGTNDHYLVRSIDITGVKALRITFGEQFGYNNDFVVTYNRGLYAGGTTTDLDSGTFNPGNWTTVMSNADPRWGGSSTWATRIPYNIGNIGVDLSSISGNTLKIAWFIGGSDVGQNGQYIIDYCNAEYAIAFPAEEN